MIHYNICESKKLAKVSFPAAWLYACLMVRVDDNGNFHSDPILVKASCMPRRADASLDQVEAWLGELDTVRAEDEDDRGLISFYSGSGDTLLHVNRFEDFQKLRSDVQPDIKFPPHPIELGTRRPYNGNGFNADNTRHADVTDAGRTRAGRGTDADTKGKGREVKRREEKEREGRGLQEFSFKTLAIKYRQLIGKNAAKIKTNRESWQSSCVAYGEDRVLCWFEEWTQQNKGWVSQKNNGLHFFWQDLPDMAEADALRAEKKVEEDRGPNVPRLEDIRPKTLSG